MKNKLLVLMIAAVIGFSALSMTGCGAETAQNDGEVVQEEVKPLIAVTETGLTATFDQTETGNGGGSGITIGEGEYLVIDSELTEGKVQVRVTRGGSDINTPPTENETAPTIDYEFEEPGVTEYGMIEPGDYMVMVNVTEKADGKIDFIVKSAEEDTTENQQQ